LLGDFVREFLFTFFPDSFALSPAFRLLSCIFPTLIIGVTILSRGSFLSLPNAFVRFSSFCNRFKDGPYLIGMIPILFPLTVRLRIRFFFFLVSSSPPRCFFDLLEEPPLKTTNISFSIFFFSSARPWRGTFPPFAGSSREDPFGFRYNTSPGTSRRSTVARCPSPFFPFLLRWFEKPSFLASVLKKSFSRKKRSAPL